MGKGLLRGTIFILSIVIDDSTVRPQPTRLLDPCRCCKFRLRYRESKRRRSPLACTTFFLTFDYTLFTPQLSCLPLFYGFSHRRTLEKEIGARLNPP